MTINPLFLLATAAFGWGLSLAIYRAVATRYAWPMGSLQKQHPLVVMLIGIAALVLTFLFILSDPARRWPVLLLGLLFALFWTGFLRVASQMALFLAPIAALLLGVVWASTDDGMREIRDLDDKLIERSRMIEGRIEDRIRGALQKYQSPVIDERISPPSATEAPASPSQAAPGTPPVPKKVAP